MIQVFCLDLEGILVPEIWIRVARRYRLKALELTTRDIPDYDKLMRYRLLILRREGIRLRDIQAVIRKMNPLPGARSFLDRLRKAAPVIIVSDTYYEFAGPLLEKLGDPILFSNELRKDRAGFISGYRLRQKNGKTKVVKALRKLGFYVKAVGDSYNDLGMLRAANEGVLFNPPPHIRKKYRFPIARSYRGLFKLL